MSKMLYHWIYHWTHSVFVKHILLHIKLFVGNQSAISPFLGGEVFKIPFFGWGCEWAMMILSGSSWYSEQAQVRLALGIQTVYL